MAPVVGGREGTKKIDKEEERETTSEWKVHLHVRTYIQCL